MRKKREDAEKIKPNETDKKKMQARENQLKAKEFAQRNRKIAATKGVTVSVPSYQRSTAKKQVPSSAAKSLKSDTFDNSQQ